VGVALLAFVACTYAAGALGFFAGVGVGSWTLVAGVVAAAALTRAAAGGERLGVAAAAALAALVLAAGAVAVGSWFYDFTTDGQAYHVPGVLALAGGWIPLDGPLPAQSPLGVYITHYPKAVWIVQAALYDATGRVEAGKAVHWMLVAAALPLAQSALRALGSAPRTAWLGAALLALNPVAVCQLSSFYVDGPLHSALLSAAALAVHWWRGRREAGVLLVLALALAVGTKFTGLVYGALLAAVLIAAALVGGAPRRRVVALAAGSVLALVTLGWEPYATNVLSRGHPFFPLFGKGAVDIRAVHETPAFRAMNPVTRLALSTFSETASGIDAVPRLKVPFTVFPRELLALAAPDPRYGGFGPLFGGALLLAAALTIAASAGGDRRARQVGLFLGAVLLWGAVNPTAWWARYAPQLWWLAVLPAALVPAPGRSRWPSAALALVLALDVAVAVAANGAVQILATHLQRRQLAQLRALSPAPLLVRFGAYAATPLRLDEAGVRYEAVSTSPCERPARLVLLPVEICFADGSPPAEWDGRALTRATLARLGM
jgi:hypothetical protein